MSYRFKVERGWASSGYDAKHYWGNPDVFHVNAESEKEATQKVAALSDDDRLAKSNRYLFRVVSAEELPPEPVAAVVQDNPQRGHRWDSKQSAWRGSAGGYIRG